MGRKDRAHLSALPGPTQVAGGTAELLADADREGSWQLMLDGVPQSHVDLLDPAYLEFEYVRRMGHVLDLTAEPDEPLDVVHLGGGALTLARYVAVTRPGSRQRVVELDEPLTELVRRELPLPRNARVRVRAADARAGLAALPDASADVVLVDVFAGARTPAHLTTVEFAADVARVLRPGGVTAWNVSDGPPLRFARAEAATLRAVFAHVALLAEPGTLRGRRFGNTVAVGSDAELPIAGLTRRCAGDPMPARVVSGADLDGFVGQAAPVTDADAQPSPQPPAGVFD
ncbi:methyltransferase domain-containing protein [Modestobacter muralis]|uniref:Methyltransferase domain-containing protein n=1 Tax=Modestobacter muralis TaxID=1608614 RepID=A0A6P0H2S7_9ACTN|nr:fused MFS/spermidine synthase [Modestobacter muralis]NEK93291.1 methyltransferase domain-containing protein [Modestobacter muralis]NEN50058.1 methyltransferase domain-containing protein [Modestobacter muralis]